MLHVVTRAPGWYERRDPGLQRLEKMTGPAPAHYRDHFGRVGMAARLASIDTTIVLRQGVLLFVLPLASAGVVTSVRRVGIHSREAGHPGTGHPGGGTARIAWDGWARARTLLMAKNMDCALNSPVITVLLLMAERLTRSSALCGHACAWTCIRSGRSGRLHLWRGITN